MNKSTTFLLLLAGLASACDDDASRPEAPTTFTGERVSMGDGQVWSIVNTNEEGEPQSLGVQFTQAALSNLPSGHAHPTEYVLQLPAGTSVPPYDHITVDWNEHGHEPPGVYDVPHFDTHFYMISASQRDEITTESENGFNEPLPAQYLAPDYMETPGGVPRMGAHIIDLRSPEIAGTGPFTHTFIYGKFNGQVNFLEPMFTKALLENKERVSKEIRQPQAWQQSGYYPARYTVEFDEDSGIYTIMLHDMTKY